MSECLGGPVLQAEIDYRRESMMKTARKGPFLVGRRTGKRMVLRAPLWVPRVVKGIQRTWQDGRTWWAEIRSR